MRNLSGMRMRVRHAVSIADEVCHLHEEGAAASHCQRAEHAGVQASTGRNAAANAALHGHTQEHGDRRCKKHTALIAPGSAHARCHCLQCQHQRRQAAGPLAPAAAAGAGRWCQQVRGTGWRRRLHLHRSPALARTSPAEKPAQAGMSNEQHGMLEVGDGWEAATGAHRHMAASRGLWADPYLQA